MATITRPWQPGMETPAGTVVLGDDEMACLTCRGQRVVIGGDEPHACVTCHGGLGDRVVVDDNGCWLWQGARNDKGYAQVRADGRTQYVHRLQYELVNGPIPADREIDHLCRVRHCVRESHLEAVTHRENQRRAPYIAAKVAQTHCIHGHPFDAENTRIQRDGTRSCRACARERGIRDWQRRLAARRAS